jgi:hypothetical protein
MKQKISIKLYSMSFFRPSNGVEMIIFTFKRSIRAEVINYRLDVVVGSLHTQQLHGFDEFCDDQVIIQNLSAQINTALAYLCLLASYFQFSISSTSKKYRATGKWLKSCFLTDRMEIKIT